MLEISALHCTLSHKLPNTKNYVLMQIYWRCNAQSEYDQDIPQSHAADQTTTPRGRVTGH